MTSRLRAASDLEGELLYFDREKNAAAKVTYDKYIVGFIDHLKYPAGFCRSWS